MKPLMNLFTKLYIKLCFQQWNIGISKLSIADLFHNKNIDSSFTWMSNNSDYRFFADPFIFKSPEGNINLIYEDFDFNTNYGKICMSSFTDKLKYLSSIELLDTKSHFSYPFIYFDKDKVIVIPEACESGNVCGYDFNFKTNSLVNKIDIIKGQPLLDSTILHYNNKYWLFATKRGLKSNSQLYIYYADNFDGPYSEHIKNPFKNNLDGTRPAGNFIKFDGQIYRPTQNSSERYGKSISLNKICKLDELDFIEELYFKINPPSNSNYGKGIHTINFLDDYLVIDGLKIEFSPLKKVKLYFNSFK
jgi:hypothetical protein